MLTSVFTTNMQENVSFPLLFTDEKTESHEIFCPKSKSHLAAGPVFSPGHNTASHVKVKAGEFLRAPKSTHQFSLTLFEIGCFLKT